MTSWNIINSFPFNLPPVSVDKAGQVPSYSEICLKEKRENYFLKPSMSQKKRKLMERGGERKGR